MERMTYAEMLQLLRDGNLSVCAQALFAEYIDAELARLTTLEAERDELREALLGVDAMLDICSITFDPDELAETFAERDIQVKDAWGRCGKVYEVMALISAALDFRATYHTKGEDDA